jgi:hypothetical protein
MKHYRSTNDSQARGGGLCEPLDQGPDPQLSPGLAQAHPADSKTPVPERVPVKLNRNFLNFPLARDSGDLLPRIRRRGTPDASLFASARKTKSKKPSPIVTDSTFLPFV